MYLKSPRGKRELGKETWRESAVRGIPRIGRFFEDVAEILLGAERAPRESFGDLYVPSEEGTYTVVEVKSFGHSHGGLRIPAKQLKLVNGEVGFVVTDCRYAAFLWKNKDWVKQTRRHRSVLSKSLTPAQKTSLIIQRTEQLFLIDPALIFAIRLLQGEKAGIFADPKEHGVVLTHRLIKFLLDDFKIGIQMIGCPTENWTMTRRKVAVPFIREENDLLNLGPELDLKMNLEVVEIRRIETPPLYTRISDNIVPIQLQAGKVVQPTLPNLR